MSRSFLFLQGVASPFFAELGKALTTAGHDVIRINYCGGDFISGRFFSVPLKYINYRGDLDGLASLYQATFDKHKITDIVLFGDTRPVHAAALKLAKSKNINIHVYEEGYFRPDWVTLDKGGVNAYSSLSKNPDDYSDSGITSDKQKSRAPKKAGGGLAIRAWHDIRYHAANLLFKPYFPHYQSHRPERALKEYWGWIKRFPSLFFYYNKKSDQQITQLFESKKDFYLLPLQLDADSQMRIHSPITTVTDLIDKTLASFSQHAPKESVLVIKIHPLDPWFINYPDVIQSAAKAHRVNENRIIYLESGDLTILLEKAKGTVLINSTVGTSALSLDCPVIALGSAIYDIEGLTYQNGLDRFWNEATRPDKKLFKSFKHKILADTQINGNFYCQKGIDMTVRESLTFFKDICDETVKETFETTLEAKTDSSSKSQTGQKSENILSSAN